MPASLVPRLRWTSCGAKLKAFQCATARVPRDYDQLHGPTITLALTRLPASDSAHRIGSLFTNPGGPGGSGVDFVQQGAQQFYSAAVRARFDIVGFDPRGVARSTPATCFATAAKENAFLTRALPYPKDETQLPVYDRETRTLAASCARTSPDRFRHISTANVARDLDLLRRAVEDRSLHYAGYSYGTFLGATYARLFPHRVEAMVLDGTVEPRAYAGTAQPLVPVGNRIQQGRGGAEVFGQFLQRCKSAGATACSLAGLGKPRTVTRRTFDALKVQPVTVTLPDGSTETITYQVAVAVTYSALYSPSIWGSLADFLSLLAVETGSVSTAQARARQGVPTPIAALLPAAHTAGRSTSAAHGADYPSIGNALSTCVDTATPPRAVFPIAAEAANRVYPDFGRYRTWVDYVCSYLKQDGIRDTDAYHGPWRQTATARVLVLGTRHDPATPYVMTRPYASLFRRAAVVTLNGWGHTTLGQSRCTDAQVTAYLLNPSRPRTDVTCPTDVVPFTTPSPAGQRRAAARERLLTPSAS